ncbi:MAG: tetratricopeptide repeat protein [Planctomycetota bacterium]|jgi:TolA-binding protein|nr:tetratricopeptide repeat protein [Planctomycetota bacterium]
MSLKVKVLDSYPAGAAGVALFLLSLYALSAHPVLAGESASAQLEQIRRLIGERGEYDLAESRLKVFVDEFRSLPAAAEALLLLGYCQDKLALNQNRPEKSQEAAASYSRVLNEYPNAPKNLRADAAMGAADAWFRIRRYEDAIRRYGEVLELSERQEQIETALMWRGEANYYKGIDEKDAGGSGQDWLDAALVDFSSFVTRFPDAKNLAAGIYGAALAAFDGGKYVESLPLLRRFIFEFPSDRRYEECLYLEGESLYRLKRYEEARAAFRRVLEKRPDGEYAPDARGGVAWVDRALGRIADAASGFEEAAKLAGEDEELSLSYLYDAGCAWQEVGDVQKAAKPLQQVAKASNHPMNGLAWLRLGTLWQEQAKEARERARAAADTATRDNFLARQKEIGGEAVNYLRKAMENGKLGDEEIEAESILGEVLLDAERYEEAARTFGEIARKWPDSGRAPWALYHRALSLREMARRAEKGRAEDLLAQAAQALRSALGHENARERLHATLALADYAAIGGDLEEARRNFRWLATEGEVWAREWRDRDGQGDPALVALAAEYGAGALFRLAESYFQEADMPRASGFYQEILTNHPETPQAAMAELRLGEIAESGKDVETARRRYESALRLGERFGANLVGSTIANARRHLGILDLRDGQRTPNDQERRAKLESALAHLSAVLENPPADVNQARVLYFLADAKYSLGMKKEALVDYGKSLAGDPKGDVSDAALYGVAWVNFELEDYPEALAAVGRLMSEFPSSILRPDAMILGATAKRSSGDAEGALADLDALLADYPGHRLAARAELERASALDELGRHEEAARAFQAFLADHPDHPDTPQALYQRSWSLWNQIKPQVLEAREAERRYRELAGNADAETLPDPDRLAALNARDEMNRAAERVRSAEDEILSLLRELTDRYPGNPVVESAWMRIGEILYDRGEYQQASAAYRRSLTLAETRKSELAVNAQYRLAWSIQRLSEASERSWRSERDPERKEAVGKEMWDRRLAAIEAFETIIGKYSKSALAGEAAYLAAELRRRSGQDNSDVARRGGWYDTAIQRYRQALEMGGADAAYQRAAEHGIALSYLLDRKFAEARERFQKFLFDYSDGPFTQEAYWGLGQANLELEAYVEAGTAFERALALDGDTETAAKALYGLGFVAAQAGDREKARVQFLDVDFRYPQYPNWAASALVSAARMALSSGQTDKAISDLERVLARYPDTPSAEEAKDLQAGIVAGDK